ncbi:hypothetical protein KJ987_07645 [bacterium]|nr:hypothetical protein [bacterium]
MTVTQSLLDKKSSSKGSGALWLIIIIGIGIAIYFAGTNHFVNTRSGIKMYPKSSFTFEETYVDMKSMSFGELRHHKDVLWVMANNGDLEYVPGGEALIEFVRAGNSLMNAVNEFDEEYQISSSIQEGGRIVKDKYDEIDKQYDVSGKIDKAKDVAKDLAGQFNSWLKKQ